MNTVPMKSKRITESDIASAAAEGVARALAARETYLRQLSPEEVAAVGGGAFSLLSKGLINGGRMDYLGGVLAPQINPVADLGGLATLGTLSRTV